ncbi:facilitated trehalose transporter Tret1-like [Temnothorax curvispinosus]|uniref:Facilitated trehalose transporter Tret1-like n=1 Tax=Temnothorax curvispinosus TaxID=300111 RepID=A0A6J1PEA6_9HYME|nr:facilitated trehalose transporter Tret1-like [Temnothorax curvispinosus]XP_024867863.1 facilitated trehalose transporter Tret1-like [Temnothorax curvispinosus]XP_024867864.1 facilitated trehalose transporter Tret1-like [Temnothorax curvispinosus]XP_024867866.1 facilitated trehalose transporter Tret1-like [Temnothorax curvispinosus]XP_024867867.1 facilitated trehalose transporter Tret1-like [Temnothorax curvispinosus]
MREDEKTEPRAGPTEMAVSERAENGKRNDEKTSVTDEVAYISKLRQAVPQCCAVGAKNLLLLTFGSTLGFSTILIPALQREDADIKVTMEELTWISSLNLFLVPIGCLASGPLSQYLGRKRTMMLANIPFVMAWLVFHYSSNPAMLLAALAMTGLTGGLLEGPVITYVAEVSQPYLRGMLSATSSMAVILGVFTQMLSGSLTHWRTVALINLTYPILCFIALCLVPESPHWLAVKGRFKESERALCWLRGWVGPSHVQNEFNALREAIQKPTDNTDADKEKIWRAYTKRTFCLPFFLVSAGFFISNFGGCTTLQTFAVVIFAKLNAPIDKYTATVFLGIAQLIGTIICVLTIHLMGKRRLTFLSVGGTGLCFLVTAIYGYLNDMDFLDGVRYSWIPTTLMIGGAFTGNLCIRTLPWILAGEVFPVKVRSSATGAAGMIAYVMASIANKTFLYMVNGMSLSGTFFFYSLINAAGLCLMYLILPETEGRTLREIEEHYAGIQSLKNRPKKEQQATKEQWAVANPAIVYDENIESKL